MFSSRALLRRLILLIPTTLLLLFLSSAGWLLLTANGLGRAAELLAWISEDAVRIQGGHGRLLGPLRLDQVEIRVDADRYRLHDVTLAARCRVAGRKSAAPPRSYDDLEIAGHPNCIPVAFR